MITNYNKQSILMYPSYILKALTLGLLMVMLIQTPLRGQEIAKYTKPSWWFGAAAGVNFNFYSGNTQKLNADLTVPKAFGNGNGAGLFVAPLIEYTPANSNFGGMFQIGYDSRYGKFKQITTPCNCPADLTSKLSYITVEPSLRFAPFKKHFYIFGGPRLAFNLAKSFTYKQGTNPNYPGQAENPDMKGDLSDVNSMLLSMQIGAGYDIPLNSQNQKTQYVLAPFVSFQPSFGQAPRSIETWNVETIRAGIAFKIGCGRKINPVQATTPSPVIAQTARLTVNSPKNAPLERRVRETFPLRNYVYFDKGSTEISDRYVLLKKKEVKDFNEDQLEVFIPKRPSGRSERQMIVYYNVLNIVGNRMQKNPSSTIALVGSSELGQQDGKDMAEAVKKYLVDIFDINPSRITTEGRDKPKIPSTQPGATQELELLEEGDRRVSIESSSPEMLMEFQSGPDAPLKPVEILPLTDAPVSSYVSFDVAGNNEPYKSWSLEVTDEKGKVQNFGPYTQQKVNLPGKSILGTRAEGDYKIVLIGKTESGKTLTKDTTVHIVLWTPPKNEEGMRYSVIFEFNDAKAITLYEKYLTEIVTPKITKGGRVIIQGYSDIIGDNEYNKKLSLARANEVKDIIEKSLAKAGRTDVTFEVQGYGEDESKALFENKYPEERSYNRTVVIDILAK
ncbi:MAG: outer membrane beta-barrel protein [Bacteroidetes bacterium]|nr:MAG: outer membrane beta-barrel protein [Bacteroidota bacterium]